MSFFISRILSKSYLRFDATAPLTSIGLQEVALLINGDVPLEAVGAQLKKLYDELPSPKYFEKHIANAILQVPLNSSLAIQAVQEMVVSLCRLQNIPFFPSHIAENIHNVRKPSIVDPDEKALYDLAWKCACAHHEEFHQLLKILNFHQEDLSEALFSFLLSCQEKNRSEKLEASLYQFRSLCPFDAKDRLNQLFISAHYKKRHDEECANERWMEIQSWRGSSAVKDLFLSKNWSAVSSFSAEKIPEFLKLCLRLDLDRKYPSVFAEWIKNKAYVKYHSMLIEQLIRLKHFSSLVPLIELNKSHLLKKMEEMIRVCPSSDQEQFCWLALQNAPTGFADPFLRNLIDKTDDIEILGLIGERFCKRNPSLFLPLLQKTLRVFDGSLSIQWSSWARSHLQSISQEALPSLFSILNHPKLSAKTKGEMLALIMPQVPKEEVPLWFELLDEGIDEASLPESFREEKARRQALTVQDRIKHLIEPDDSLLEFSACHDLLFQRVLFSQSISLKRWLLEKGNLNPQEQRELAVQAYVKHPSDETEQFLKKIIEACQSVEEIEALWINPDFEPCQRLYKCLCEVLRKLPPHASKSPVVLLRIIDNSIKFFPWEHYAALITLFPHMHTEVTPKLTLALKELSCVPLIFFELHERITKGYFLPETLIALFVFSNAFEMPNFLGLQVDNLNILLEKHPECLSKIPLKEIVSFLKKVIKPKMSNQGLIFLGKLLAGVNEADELKEWMRKYSQQLIELHFGHLTFADWATKEVESNEISWDRVQTDYPIKKMSVSKQPKKAVSRSLSISFDPKQIQDRIFKERLLSLDKAPDPLKNQLIKSLNKVKYEGPENTEELKWVLNPLKNRELIYIFLEELANWHPPTPTITSFKNSFCRSLMRQYCMSATDVDYERILDINLRCFATNALPLFSVSSMETWGFQEIALLAVTFANFRKDILHTHLQVVNLISLGSCYESSNHVRKDSITSALEKISMELLGADYLHPLFILKALLKENREFISASSYEALMKRFKEAKTKILPSSLKSALLTPALFASYPTLLWQSLEMLAKGALSQEAKVNLYDYAYIAYNQLWTNRTEMSDEDLREFLIADIAHISTLVKYRGDISLQKLEPICIKWANQMLQLSRNDEAIEEKEKSRLSVSILTFLKQFEGYFVQNPDLFFDLWKRSRKLFSSVPNVNKLKLHNELTKGFSSILSLKKSDFQSMIQQECERFDEASRDLLKQQTAQVFPFCDPWDLSTNPKI